MANKLDGLQKVNPGNLKTLRKIVLDTIEEKDKKKKILKPSLPKKIVKKNKKIDSITKPTITRLSIVEKKQKAITSPKPTVLKPVVKNKKNPINIKIKLVAESLLASIFMFLVFYSSFVLFILFFNFDNKLTRVMSQRMPVPALVSSVGVVEYYDYIDTLNTASVSSKKELDQIIVKKMMKDNEVEKLRAWSLIN
jgi:hypothetical protein